MDSEDRPRTALPNRSERLFEWFRWYAVHYVRKHFHAVRLSKGSAAVPAGDAPLVAVMNHPSWWDAMIGFPLLPLFPGREHYAAIDADAIQKYRIFTRLGFFGVDTKSFRGAVEFLRTGEAILSKPNRAVWITGQGRFTDARTRPLDLRSGVGHLAARLERGVVLPVAVEYTFWTERTPEALVRFGNLLDVTDHPGLSGKEWTAKIETALTEALDALADDAMSRDPERFDMLVSGKVGVGGVYDHWRRAGAWLRGRRFDASHGGEPT